MSMRNRPQAQENRNYPAEQEARAVQGKKTVLWMIIGLLASLIFLAIVAYFTIHIWEQPTCTEPAVCRICGKVNKDSMLGHDWGEVSYVWSADKRTVTARRVCRNDSSHVEEETVNTTAAESVAASCDKEGTLVYTAAFKNEAFETQTREEPIEKTGHDWGEVTYTWSDDRGSVTARRVCRNDSSHVEEETVKTTSKLTAEASCDKEGKRVYTAKFTNSAFETQTREVTVKKTAHSWGKVSYSWSKDHKTAYAGRSCKNCGKEDTASTTDISYAVTKEPSCTKSGTCVYTATFKNADFGTCQETATLAAKGHDWIAATTEAPKTCRRCGATEGERLKTDYEKLVEKCRKYDSKIELPTEKEMLSKPVTRYVRGLNPPPGGGIYLCRKPGDDVILKLDNYTELTVYAVRGTLSSGYALVETSGGKLGWVRTDRLSETSDFSY